MTAIPLSRDGSLVIVLAPNEAEYLYQVTKYGLSGETLRAGIFPVYSLDEAHTVSLGMPDGTPWCVMDGPVSEAAKGFLNQVYGTPVTVAVALNVQNNEYAISPRALQRAGA